MAFKSPKVAGQRAVNAPRRAAVPSAAVVVGVPPEVRGPTPATKATKYARSAGRIAIVSSSFWPEPIGVSQTVSEFAAYVARQGFDVRVVTAMPFYPGWSIWQAYRGRFQLTEQHDGVRISRSWHFVRPRLGTGIRLLHELTLCATAVVNLCAAIRGSEVAYIVSPPLSFAWLASVIAKLMRVRSVLCVKDILPDAAIELGMLKSRTAIALSRWLARGAYGLADEIHTLGEGMRHRIAREAGSLDKIRVVPDTIDADELAPVPAALNEFRHRFVPENTFAVVHTGNMGQKQDLDLLLRAADRLRDDPRVQFYVFGDGAAKAAFLRRRAELGLPNVAHHPLQERRMLRHMLSGADVVLVSQVPQVVDIVVPSKLITALGAGAMILAACPPGSDTARIVEQSGGGIVVPAGDDAAFVTALLRIRNGEVDVSAYRARARAFALKVFDRAAVYGPLVSELLEGRAARRSRELSQR